MGLLYIHVFYRKELFIEKLSKKCIHCLVFVKVQQVLMNVNGEFVFHMEEFNETPLHLCQTSFCYSKVLLLFIRRQEIIGYKQEFLTSTAMSPTSTSDMVSQCNKIGVFTFRAIFIGIIYNPLSNPYRIHYDANKNPEMGSLGKS